MPARRHLFIVTYGRTGSTLLQAILNAHPGIRIFGEKSGLPYQLYRCLQTLDNFERHQPEDDTPSHPFFGISHFPFTETREEMFRRFDSFLPPAEDGILTRGFKEVRHDQPDLDNYLDFLNHRFEDSCFLFLTRDHEAVMGSGFYATADPDRIRQHLTLLDQRFHAYASWHPDRCIEIAYPDLLDFEKVRKLLECIGHVADETAWRTAVATKHSYAQRSVVELTEASQFVLFDAAKAFVEAWRFDEAAQHLKHSKSLSFAGVILPRIEAGPLQSLELVNGNGVHEARVGLPSPRFVEKWPAHPHAATARFSFADHPIDLCGETADFELFGTFAHAGRQCLGRLFSGGRSR